MKKAVFLLVVILFLMTNGMAVSSNNYDAQSQKYELNYGLDLTPEFITNQADALELHRQLLSAFSAETPVSQKSSALTYSGLYAEQYVLEQFILKYDNLYYYTNDRNSAEIEYLIEYTGNIIPVEVKAGINLKAKSLKTYIDKYKPVKALRFSLADYKATDNLIDIPLYAINFYENYL